MLKSSAVLDGERLPPSAEESAFDGIRLDEFRARVAPIADIVENKGVACLEDVVSRAWLSRANSEIESRYSMHGIRETVVENVGARPDSFAHAAVGDGHLRAFLTALAEAGHPKLSTDESSIENVLRMVRSPAPPDEPLGFHYDRSVVTMVVPIQMPRGAPGESGELIMCANRRPYRRLALTNVAEKAAMQNDAFRSRFIRSTLPKSDITLMAMRPGNAYVFWGYRSFHATLPCPPDTVRTTLVLHCGIVHGASALLARSKDVGSRLRTRRRRKTSSADYLVLQETD